MTVAAVGRRGRAGSRLPAEVLSVGFAGCAAVALAVALRAPLLVMVVGLVLFGALHNLLELRYVAGRFGDVLRGRLLWTLLALVSGIVFCRLLGLRTPEILFAYAVLLAGIRHAVPGRWFWPATAGLVVAAAASLTWPAYHFVVLSHLHNLVPLVFLWEWSRALPILGRAWFRAVQVGWVLVVPALVLAGVFDPLIVGDGGAAVVAFAGEPAQAAAPVTPPGLVVGVRFLVVFAFLQAMHYVVWVGFLPRYAPEAAVAFARRVPWLRGWRIWALGAAVAAGLGVLLLADYSQGRSLYQALASYHAYLEFPVLLALLFGWSRPLGGLRPR